MNFTQEQIDKRFDAAPTEVQEALQSQELLDLYSSIEKTYGLHLDTMGEIVELNRNLMLGLTSPAEFLGELVLAGVDANTARKVIGDLNDKIFVPIQKQMRESGVARAPMSAPVPPPPAAAVPAFASAPVSAVVPAPTPVPVFVAPPQPVQAPIISAAIPAAAPLPPMPPKPVAPTAPAATVMPVSMPAPARTAPPPPDLPGSEELLRNAPAAPTVPPAEPLRTIPTERPQPAAQPPTPVAPVSIYSARPSAPAMPPTRPTGSVQASVMWQTPVPAAWQKGGVVRDPVHPSAPSMTPPEKSAPRTMEGDMQLAAQMAAQPQESAPRAEMSVPQAQPAAPAPEPAPAPISYAQPVPEPAVSSIAPQASHIYVPPPRPVKVAPAPLSDDPYREPIDATDL